MPLRENQEMKMDKKATGMNESSIDAIKAVVPEEIRSQSAGKDPNYWQSFRQLYNDPAFISEKKKEFTPSALINPDPKNFSKLSRRKFLALLSASAAVA